MAEPSAKKPSSGMQQEDDADVDRRPRQVEDRVDAGAGDELAEGVEIAQRLAACGAVVERSIDGRRHNTAGEHTVEPDAGAGEHAGADRIERRPARRRPSAARCVSMTSVTTLR